MSQFRRPTYPPDLVKVPKLILVLFGAVFLGLLWLSLVCIFENEARAQTQAPALRQGTGPQSGPAVVNAHNGVENCFDDGLVCIGGSNTANGTANVAALRACGAKAGQGGHMLVNQPYAGAACYLSASTDVYTLLQGQTVECSGRTNNNDSEGFVDLDGSGIGSGNSVFDVLFTNGNTIQGCAIAGGTPVNNGFGIFAESTTALRVINTSVRHFNVGLKCSGDHEISLYDSLLDGNNTGLWMINGCEGVSHGTLVSNSGDGTHGFANIYINGAGNFIFDADVIDESFSIPSIRIDQADNVTFNVANILAANGNAVDTIVVGDGTHSVDNFTLNGALIQQFGHSEVLAGRDIHVQANATNVIFRNVNMSGQAIDGQPAPPVIAYYQDDTGQAMRQNVYITNAPDAGYITPWAVPSTTVQPLSVASALPKCNALAEGTTFFPGDGGNGATKQCVCISTGSSAFQWAGLHWGTSAATVTTAGGSATVCP